MRIPMLLTCGLLLVACSGSPAPETDVPDTMTADATDTITADTTDAMDTGETSDATDATEVTAPDAPLDVTPDATPDAGIDVPPPTPLPLDYMGMCPIDSDPDDAEWDRVKAWGVKLTRQGFFWEWITKDDGELDFTWPDRYFQDAEERGIKVLVDLCYDNKRNQDPDDVRPVISAAHLAAWRTYVAAMATRYKDRAWGFEVWNEPNLDIFWKGSIAEFVAVAKVTVQAVHEFAPGVPVSVAGLASAGLDYLDALQAEGIVGEADAVSFHPYWVDAEGSVDTIGIVQSWLYQNHLDKPLWLTEYGWPTGGTYPHATTLDGQAERLIRFQAGAAQTGVRASWMFASYDWYDPVDVEDPSNSEGFFGVAYRTAGDKPAAHAFQVLAGLLPGSTPDPAIGNTFAAGTGLDVTGFRRPDGTIAIIATNRTTAAIVVPLPDGATVVWPESVDGAPIATGPITVVADRSVILTGPASMAEALPTR
jgi:hypothetical protein